MRGAQILLIVASLAALLLWLALRDPTEAGLTRGVEETDVAFATVEDKLRELTPDYQWLGQQGLVLALKEEYDGIVTSLARLRNERLDVTTDATLDPRARLPRMRQIVASTDNLMQRAIVLAKKVTVRRDFMETCTPLLREARGLRDELSQRAPDDDALAVRILELGGSFADLEGQALLADRLMRTNPEQGLMMGEQVLGKLHTLIEQQQALLARID